MHSPGRVEDQDQVVNPVVKMGGTPSFDFQALFDTAYIAEERYQYAWHVADLMDSIRLARASHDALMATTPDLRSNCLLQRTRMLLARCLSASYAQFGVEDDLSEQIRLTQDAVDSFPISDPGRAAALRLLGAALRSRYERNGSIADLLHAVSLHQEALEIARAASHYDLWDSLSELGRSLMRLYQRQGKEINLSEAISSHRKALVLCPEGCAGRSSVLHNLGDILWVKYTKGGTFDDLEESIQCYLQALALRPHGHGGRHLPLNGLGAAFMSRFEQSTDIVDLNASITYHREALSNRELGHPDRFKSLSNLSAGLMFLFTKTGDTGDLDQAVLFIREAYEICLEGHTFRGHVMVTLSNVLSKRFAHSGNMVDLEEAIDLKRKVLSRSPPGNALRDTALSNLGNTLQQRWVYSGNAVDLTESAYLLRELLTLNPPGHPYFGHALTVLATAFVRCYEQFKDSTYLSEIIALHREWDNQWKPGNRSRVAYASAVARVFHLEFGNSEDIHDLDEAIALYRSSLSLRPHGDPERRVALRDVAVALLDRFKSLRHGQDAEEAMDFLNEARASAHIGHPYRARVLFSLARMHTTSGFRYLSLNTAVDYTCQALEDTYCNASIRIQDASEVLQDLEVAIRLSDTSISLREQVLHVYQLALSLLPQVAFIGLRIRSQLQVLAKAENLAARAAAHALLLERPEAALQILEEGRAVFWSQYLRLHMPFDDLPPQLSKELHAMAQMLQQGGYEPSNPRATHDNDINAEMEAQAAKQRWLGQKYEVLLAEAQRVTRRLQFGPRNATLLASLMTATNGQPVLVLLSSESTCRGILVNNASSAPQQITFHGVTLQKLIALGNSLKMAHRDGRNAIEGRDARAMVKTINGHRNVTNIDNILSELWTSVMKPIIDVLGLAISSGKGRPRLYVCATGAFTHLPVHAAGLHFKGKGIRDGCSEYTVVSHIPTLGALVKTREAYRPTRRADARVMVAAVPQPHKWAALPYVVEEADIIKASVPPYARLALPLNAEHSDVIENLPHATILHMACHGFQDREDPLDSGFVMKDRTLSVLELMSLQLPNAFLAFLSACETAKSNEKQPDEAIHLAATMLFTGVPSVVATMWSMGDVDGPIVAKTVYEALFDGESQFMDLETIPYALDNAVRELRRRGLSSSRWATYVHLGL